MDNLKLLHIDVLLEAYNRSIKLGVNSDFIALLEKEIKLSTFERVGSKQGLGSGNNNES